MKKKKGKIGFSTYMVLCIYNLTMEDQQHSNTSINLPHNSNEENIRITKYFRRNFEIHWTVIGCNGGKKKKNGGKEEET